MNPTDDQLRVAACKAMGWRQHQAGDGIDYWIDPKTPTLFGATLPPLTLDLMWQAEQTLFPRQIADYLYTLALETSNDERLTRLNLSQKECAVMATASQRACAFLKVRVIILS